MNVQVATLHEVLTHAVTTLPTTLQAGRVAVHPGRCRAASRQQLVALCGLQPCRICYIVKFFGMKPRMPESFAYACRVRERDLMLDAQTRTLGEERARLTASAATLGAREAAIAHQEVREQHVRV